jgi:hypothetical protein
VVQGDVEDLGDARGDVEAGGAPAVLITADLAGVGADLLGEQQRVAAIVAIRDIRP